MRFPPNPNPRPNTKLKENVRETETKIHVESYTERICKGCKGIKGGEREVLRIIFRSKTVIVIVVDDGAATGRWVIPTGREHGVTHAHEAGAECHCGQCIANPDRK